MISFSCLDNLVTYLFAFYDSMKIDMNLQFDFLPVKVRKSNKAQTSKDQLENCLEAYFKDQKLRQARKAQSKVGCIDELIESSRAKKKKITSRTKYYKKVKRNQRGKECTLAKECAKKKLARQNPTFKASEKEQQRAYKQEARKKPGILAKNVLKKKASKTKSHFKASEKEEQHTYMQEVKKKTSLKQVKKNNSVLISRKRERTPSLKQVKRWVA